MSESLSAEELVKLIERVFRPRSEDRALAVLVDLPDAQVADRKPWAERRRMATDWVERLRSAKQRLGLEVNLVLYRNAHMNNADLPKDAWIHLAEALPDNAEDLDPAAAEPFEAIFDQHRILLAPTEFSATAPLKLAARETGVRAATMPGFSSAMIPALKLDYGEINRRVVFISDLLTRAKAASLRFLIDGRDEYELTLDLRHRSGHASGGLFPEPGQAGNLPSGESYIVPYEGERKGDKSRTAGWLPVQLGSELVIYRVENNRAVTVEGEGRARDSEAERLEREPAYGNLAELGLGVLADLGLEPIGQILLDEKLGLHIAFGRSDHFGGQVGAAQFSSPEAVVHIDRVYLPGLQPRVVPAQAQLHMPDGSRVELIRNGRYVIEFPGPRDP